MSQQTSSNTPAPQGPIKDSLVKYDSPVLVAEKSSTEKPPEQRKKLTSALGKKSTPKLPPVVDQSKAPSQIEEILNSTIPPRYVKEHFLVIYQRMDSCGWKDVATKSV